MAVKSSAKKTVKAETVKKEAKKVPLRRLSKPAEKGAAKAKSCCCNDDEKLAKLAASRIPANFVKKNNGCWNHQQWLDFLVEIEKIALLPKDTDRVGLILEEEKRIFFSGK